MAQCFGECYKEGDALPACPLSPTPRRECSPCAGSGARTCRRWYGHHYPGNCQRQHSPSPTSRASPDSAGAPAEVSVSLWKHWTGSTKIILWTSSTQKLCSTSHVLPKADLVQSRRIANLSAVFEGSCGREQLNEAGKRMLCSGRSNEIPQEGFGSCHGG